MLNFLRRKPAVKYSDRDDGIATESPLAYFIPAGTTRLVPIKADHGMGWQGYGGAFNTQVNSSRVGHAQAWVASVWANRAVDIKARAISRLTPQIIQKRDGKVIENHPFIISLERSQQRIIRKIEWATLIWGEAFIYPRRNEHGYHSDMTWLNNLSVDIQYGAGIIDAFMYTPLEGGKPFVFYPLNRCHRPDDKPLVMFKTDNPFSDLRGLSKFETVLLEIGIDVDIARTTRAFYANDARPGLLLIPEKGTSFQPADAMRIIDTWKANFQGSRNAGKPAIVPSGIAEVKEIQRPPGLDDVELRESVRREIAAAFGVPLSVLGAWDDATYQSAPEQRKSFYEETIIPEADDLADDITNLMLPLYPDSAGMRFKLDAADTLALIENELEKVNILNSQLASGGISLNEYRLGVGKSVLPNGNVHFIPATSIQVNADDIGELYSKPSYVPFGNPSVTIQQAVDMAQGTGINVPKPPSELADPNGQPALPEGETQKAGQSACVLMSIPDTPDMLQVRQRVADYLRDIPIQWNAPDTYHITLAYAPSITPEQAQQLGVLLNDLPIAPLDLNIGSLSTFDDMGRYAVHFRIRQNSGLRALQAQVYEACQKVGIQTSMYSTPEKFIPHITLGYAAKQPRSQTYNTKITVQPGALQLSTSENNGDDYEVVYERAIQAQPDTAVATNDERVPGGKDALLSAPQPDQPAPVAEQPHPRQTDALDELRAWEKKALNKGAIKARDFVCYSVPDDLQMWVRETLEDGMDKPAIKAVFYLASEIYAGKQAPPTPREILRYWRRYDQLVSSIGNVWLSDYMRRAWDVLQNQYPDQLDAGVVSETLTALHEDIVSQWVGTPDQPGALAKVVLAGMAAGNEALRGKNPDPNKADENPLNLEIDWALMPQEAYDFVKQYAFKLIRGIDATTTAQVQTALSDWLARSGTLDELTDELETIFNNPDRAHLIAQTESTRAYYEGSRYRWEQAGVSKGTWRTVRDALVCPICAPLNGIESTFEAGWGDQGIQPPAHPGCRCFVRPVVD